MRTILVATLLLISLPLAAQPSPPSWAKEVVWYQVFVERFHNGDKKNDPRVEDISIAPLNQYPPAGWTVTPWTKSWYEQEPWASKAGLKFNEGIQFRRYGGDLQGLLDKLDYLQELGVNALFLNPINHAPSLHKYDATSYHHVDANFGPDPKGDLAIMARENPVDPATWKWTSADKLFLKLVQEVHRRKMRIIMDYSWNHTGTRFWAWQDILKNGEKSAYKDWFAIKTFDNPATPANEFAYAGWANVPSLPEIRKVDVKGHRVSGVPYEGNIHPAAKQHMFEVARRWLAPNGNVSQGIDGFRLDVADQVGLGFWRDFRKHVRSIQPHAYLVGEIWWRQWPDHLMDPLPYVKGDVFDAVMFYQVYRPARYFFAKTTMPIDAKAFKDSLTHHLNRLPESVRHAMMNTSSSHDAPRLLTDFANPNKYKFKATPNDDPHYFTGRPDEETYQRLRLYLVNLFTGVGAPQIWNGEEMGMWGADDPHDRKPLWWSDLKFDNEARNNFQPGTSPSDPVGFNPKQFEWYKKLVHVRRTQPILWDGKLEFLVAEGRKLAYVRSNDKGEILVLFNTGSERAQFILPRTGNYLELLTNKTLDVTKLWLDPQSAMILKKL
ncbi:MAG: glycoside hydrolase family 13 protein [Cyclobacteriaceae bacterium]|nr:glycoside hydrolase family 13 protein [Cyclobacteriaceae bacterium]